MDEAVRWVIGAAKAPGKGCQFVVTPNADHALLLQKSDALRRAYRDASLVIADGWPVVLAARLLGHPLSERVTGSDLVPAVFTAASSAEPLRVFLLRAAPGVAERAGRDAAARYPGDRVVGGYGPALAIQREADEH